MSSLSFNLILKPHFNENPFSFQYILRQSFIWEIIAKVFLLVPKIDAKIVKIRGMQS